MLDSVWFCIVAVLALALSFFAYNVYQYSIEKTLRCRVSWCVTDDSHIYRCNMSLLDWLCQIQQYGTLRFDIDYSFPKIKYLSPIDKKYWICEDNERDIARKILKVYQKELSQKYFSNQLTNVRYLRNLTDEEYFLVTLAGFLRKYECEKTFNGEEMYSTKSYDGYGSWGTPLFDAVYELTDFAVVYHKMYYIAQSYCWVLDGKPISQTGIAYHELEHMKKVLDTREIEVSNN